MNLYLFCYKKPDRFYSLCKIHLLLLNVVITSCNSVDTFSIFPKSSLLDLPLPKMPSILNALSGLFEKEFALNLWNVPVAGLTRYVFLRNLLRIFLDSTVTANWRQDLVRSILKIFSLLTLQMAGLIMSRYSDFLIWFHNYYNLVGPIEIWNRFSYTNLFQSVIFCLHCFFHWTWYCTIFHYNYQKKFPIYDQYYEFCQQGWFLHEIMPNEVLFGTTNNNQADLHHFQK